MHYLIKGTKTFHVCRYVGNNEKGKGREDYSKEQKKDTQWNDYKLNTAEQFVSVANQTIQIILLNLINNVEIDS